nr:hypothetical protein JVH1_8454 [Rhodococcus sp. JVH1]
MVELWNDYVGRSAVALSALVCSRQFVRGLTIGGGRLVIWRGASARFVAD